MSDDPRSRPWPGRFPYSAYPNGWFRAAHSNDLEVGEVKSLQLFGRELVLFRSESGVARIFDAHCPHLGANLAVGGCVTDEGIRCPFHHWLYDGEGKCIEVPYAKRVPPGVKLRAWPVDEKNGLIMLHHDAEEKAPGYELPVLSQLEDPAWTALRVQHWKVRSRWLDMNENSVDIAHFKYVHGTLSVPRAEVTQQGHVFRVDGHFEQKAPGGTAEGHLVSSDFGPGFQTIEMDGILDSLMVNTATPIDEDYTDLAFAYYFKTEGEPRKERLAQAMLGDLLKQAEHDMPIWESKAYLEKPRLCDGDGPIGLYRKWASQFFSAGASNA